MNKKIKIGSYELEKLEDGKIVVRRAETQGHPIAYTSSDNLSDHNRRKLSYLEDFLRKCDEIDEADKIKGHLGKIIRYQHIPQLMEIPGNTAIIPMRYLKARIEDWIKEDGLQLDPDFQRAHVWTHNQRVAFVEYVLRGGKINPLYFNHPGWMKDWKGEMVIVDGKQRLTSLLMFLNDEIMVFKDLDPEGDGYTAKHFNTFGVGIPYAINTLKTKREVLTWYLEINRGHVAHTEEELSRVEELLKQENGRQ